MEEEKMTEATKEKKTYRNIGVLISGALKDGALTVDEITEKTGVIKWYVEKRLTKMVEKGKIKLVDDKYDLVTTNKEVA